MNIIEMRISDIKPYENNPRNNEQAVDVVAASINEFGFKVPIVIDKDNVIVTGHTRLKAAEKLGLESVPVIKADDLTEEQVKAFRLADNKTAEFAEWDFAKLEEELSRISEIDMAEFGFTLDDEEAEEPEIFEDEVPEVKSEAKTKLGEVYQLGVHRLMCGDSTSEENVKTLMDGEIADIAFTSPPYNASAKGYELQQGKVSKYDGADDNKSEEEYKTFLNEYLRNALEVSEYVFMNVQSIANNKISLIDVLHENKDIYADTIVWDKGHAAPAMANNVLNSRFEYVHIFSKKANRAIGTIPFRGTIDNVVQISMQHNNEYADIHNATFSVEFAAWFISNFASESVLDNFGGTGTTMIACEQLGKKCFMMEYEPKYCDVIIERWEKLTGQKAKLIKAGNS